MPLKNFILLPGYACQSWIWDEIVPLLDGNCVKVEYPAGKFLTVKDFSEWVFDKFCKTSPLNVIGHSMGGLIGLELLSLVPIHRLLLLETFVTSPGPFFQNLFMEGSKWGERIEGMLTAEKKKYGPELQLSLRNVDCLETVERWGKKITAVYGDRGTGNPQLVKERLNWPSSLEGVRVEVVPDACHFPMLENPKETAAMIKKMMRSI